MAAAPRYEVEVNVSSAKDLKNVNWRNGDLRPYAVLWIDDGQKSTTKADVDNDVNPVWDEKVVLLLPYSSRLDAAVLHIDIVHAVGSGGSGDRDVKPLVGSAKLNLRDVLDEAGMGGKVTKNLKLKRPSGRPHGRLDVKVAVKEPSRYGGYGADPYPAPYGTRDAYAGGSGGYGGYGAPPSQPYGGYGAPPPQPAYGGYGAPPSQPAYAGYGAAAPYGGGYGGYGAPQPPMEQKGGGYGGYGAAPVQPPVDQKKGKFGGMGAGLAVGAVAGVLGGVALAEGAGYLENKFEDHVAEKVYEREEENAYDDDDDGGDY